MIEEGVQVKLLEPLKAPRIGVLVSGAARGSNLQALLDACNAGEIEGKIVLTVGTRAEAQALERARCGGSEVHVVSPRKYAGDEEAYGEALLKVLLRHDVQLLCLAGYLLRLPTTVVEAYRYRVLNIHPALLPLFGGRGMYGEHVHRAVLESGMKVSGCTVHFVDHEYDTGPILVQRTVPVLDEDTPETLAARLLPEEHKAYVQAVQLRCARLLRVEGRRVKVVPSS